MNWISALLRPRSVTTPLRPEREPLSVRPEQRLGGEPDFSCADRLPREIRKLVFEPHSRARELWHHVWRDLSESPERRVRVVSIGGCDAQSVSREFRDGYFFLWLTGQLPPDLELVDTSTYPPGSRGYSFLYENLLRDVRGVISASGVCEFGYVSTLTFGYVKELKSKALTYAGRKSGLPNAERSTLVLYYDLTEKLRHELESTGEADHVGFFGYDVGHREHDLGTILASFGDHPTVALRIVSLRSGSETHQLAEALNDLAKTPGVLAGVTILTAVASSPSNWEAAKAHVLEVVDHGEQVLVLATDAESDLMATLARSYGASKILRVECGS